jgi:hypothetical protein
MVIAILAAVLGLLIATAAIAIPRVVARRNNPEDHADSQAYLKETGRSAQDIAQGNAGQAFGQQNDAGSRQAGGSDGAASHGGAGSRETS